MEAEEQINEQQYLEAFNNGYLLAQYEPQLAAKLFKQPNAESPYFNAMAAGKTQYEAENKDLLQKFRRVRSTSTGNDLNKANDDKKLKR